MEYHGGTSYNPSSSNSSVPPRAPTTPSASSVSAPVPYSSSEYGQSRHVGYGSNYPGPDYNQQGYMSGGNAYPSQPYHYSSQNNSATLNQLLQPNSNFPRGCQQTYNAQNYGGYENYNWSQFNRNHTSAPSEASHVSILLKWCGILIIKIIVIAMKLHDVILIAKFILFFCIYVIFIFIFYY